MAGTGRVDPSETFPGDHIRESVQTSLRILGLDTIDVLQFHVWSDEWVGRGDWLETVDALKQEGLIRHFGVSINDYQPENALELICTGVEAVQVIYNVFHQQPEEQLLRACAEHGVGVIVRVALDDGGLTGRIGPDTEFSESDWRNNYFGGDRRRQVAEHVDALVSDLGIERDALPERAAIRAWRTPSVDRPCPDAGQCATSNATPRSARGNHCMPSSAGRWPVTAGSATSTNRRDRPKSPRRQFRTASG